MRVPACGQPVFSARFFLVVIEATPTGRSLLHMWLLQLSAQPLASGTSPHWRPTSGPSLAPLTQAHSHLPALKTQMRSVPTELFLFCFCCVVYSSLCHCCVICHCLCQVKHPLHLARTIVALGSPLRGWALLRRPSRAEPTPAASTAPAVWPCTAPASSARSWSSPPAWRSSKSHLPQVSCPRTCLLSCGGEGG